MCLGETKQKPGEIVFPRPTEAEPLREPSQSPNLSRCAYHTLCFQLVTLEGSEVITKPRWRALPCLRPNEALGRGGCPSPYVPAYLWCFGARAQERRSPQIVFVLPTEEWPRSPSLKTTANLARTWCDSLCPLPHQSLSRWLWKCDLPITLCKC